MPMITRIAVLMLLMAAVAIVPPFSASAEQYQGRLSRLLLNKASMYLPTRLILGHENKFIIKAQPGSHVRLFLSPQAKGYTLPNGLGLKVGEEHEALDGLVPPNGVLELVVPLPDEAAWEGKMLYVDAVVSGEADFSAANPVELIDPTGRRADANVLVLAKPAAKDGGLGLMPAMPGLPSQTFQQITTMSEIYSNPDDHRKEYLDTGELNRDAEIDQNPFAQRYGINGNILGR